MPLCKINRWNNVNREIKKTAKKKKKKDSKRKEKMRKKDREKTSQPLVTKASDDFEHIAQYAPTRYDLVCCSSIYILRESMII